MGVDGARVMKKAGVIVLTYSEIKQWTHVHEWLLATISEQINGNIVPGLLTMWLSRFYKLSSLGLTSHTSKTTLK